MKTQKKPDWREARRQQAWNLHEQGWKQEKIAEALGVQQGTVSKWLSRVKEEGEAGLSNRPRTGRPRKLGKEYQPELKKHLEQGAEAHGYRGNIWTTKRVVDLIGRLYGVHYHPVHGGRLLRELNWTRQQPAHKASQRNEEAIERWKTEQWPEIKKSA